MPRQATKRAPTAEETNPRFVHFRRQMKTLARHLARLAPLPEDRKPRVILSAEQRQARDQAMVERLTKLMGPPIKNA
jgi:hypothetical protein